MNLDLIEVPAELMEKEDRELKEGGGRGEKSS